MSNIQSLVDRWGKKLRKLSMIDWVEISMWGLTLIMLVVFAITAGTETADTIAALGFVFALLLIFSLVLTVGIRYLRSKKQKMRFNKRRG